ncbi:MAG: putative 4-hydroxybenzoate polyprenyltransferase [Planctomycetes bacterium]|nr:putative 4-hydroxybenzoate polyprenyltransferase [Planctomycetota bacterium]
MQSPIKLIKTYASFVKLAHTVFALPFALTGMIVAYAVPTRYIYILPGPDGTGMNSGSFDQHVPFLWTLLLLILLCMVGARSFAMAVNRILDRKIDAKNPRTAVRELPAGAMTLTQAWVFVVGMAVVYFGACAVLSDVVLALSPIPILLMLLYPLTKRFTWLCHLVLGMSLGLAPVGAWVAVRAMAPDGNVEIAATGVLPDFMLAARAKVVAIVDTQWSGLGWESVAESLPWLLGGAVMLWVAGFDVIYALQDDEFDRDHKLKSIPARFGRKGALWISRLMHLFSAALFFAFVWLLLNPASVGGMDTRQYTEIATWVWAAPCVMLVGMIYQHSLVKHDNLKRVNLAFFTVNGVISVVFGGIFLLAWLLY